MDRRAFLAASALASFEGFSLSSATVSLVFADVNQTTTNGNARQPVLVRSGFTRTSDGADERAPSPVRHRGRSFARLRRAACHLCVSCGRPSPISRRSSSRASRAG